MNEQVFALRLLRARVSGGFRLALLRISLGVALLGLVVLASLRIAPSVDPQGSDSAIFAMVGRVILDGGLPYRDAWDNKTPGVYYIDALAMLLFGANQWALWIGDLIVIYATAVLMWGLVWWATRHGLLAATASIVFLFIARHAAFASHSNFTESYALLPQVLCFVLGYGFLLHPSRRLSFALGAAASAIFLIKQSSIGVALVFVLALLLSWHPVIRAPQRWTWLATFVAGGLSVLGVVAAYFAWHGVLRVALDAILRHPVAFHEWVSVESSPWWRAGIETLTQSWVVPVLAPLFPLFVLGIRAALRRLRDGSVTDRRDAAFATLTIWAAVTLVVDLGLVNITGREYTHYYITLAPSVALLTAAGLAALFRSRAAETGSQRKDVSFLVGVVVYTVVVTGLYSLAVTIDDLSDVGWNVWQPARRTWPSAYVIQHTEPDDRVLVWGARAQVNFQTGRMSPTRYHYSYALIVEGYTTGERVQELIAELEANPPALILDTSLADGPKVPPIDPAARKLWRDVHGRPAIAALDPFFDYVLKTCQAQDVLDPGITVYRCAGADRSVLRPLDAAAGGLGFPTAFEPVLVRSQAVQVAADEITGLFGPCVRRWQF